MVAVGDAVAVTVGVEVEVIVIVKVGDGIGVPVGVCVGTAEAVGLPTDSAIDWLVAEDCTVWVSALIGGGFSLPKRNKNK